MAIKSDTSNNVFVLGAPSGDAIVADSGVGSRTALSAAGERPPFDTANPFCALSPGSNLIAVLNADSSLGPSALHVYSISRRSWTLVRLQGADQLDPTSFAASLDHDTNVIYAYSKGQVLGLGNLDSENISKVSDSSSITMSWWPAAGNSQPFAGTYNAPVVGQGTNHLHYFNAPGLLAGQAYIFVIHYAWWQPAPQTYGTFLQSPSQTTYIPKSGSAPSDFAYIPDDGVHIYLISTHTNTTATFPGFGVGGAGFRYAATENTLVQLDTGNGNIKTLSVANPDWGAMVVTTLVATDASVAISPATKQETSRAVATGTAVVAGPAAGTTSSNTSGARFAGRGVVVLVLSLMI
ncbi:hypothetical protein BC830DRAFT_1107915 [Chytriomyces sp. MP71]|nr:hypothetical protein BC830DRAFT_1107915 [Chytriomyces sp. MP71]